MLETLILDGTIRNGLAGLSFLTQLTRLSLNDMFFRGEELRPVSCLREALVHPVHLLTMQ